MDLASAALLPRTTAGDVHHYQPFSFPLDTAQLYNDLHWTLVRPQVQRRQKVANRNVWDFGWEMRSRGRFATPGDSPRHDCSPYSHVHVRRVRLGFTRRSRAIFCRPVPKPSVTIREKKCITVQVNSRTHVPQKLTDLISLSTNPVSILSVPIQTVR